MSLLSAPAQSVFIKKKVLMKSPADAAQTMFLSKQVWTIVGGRQRDAQTIKVLGAYTLLR